MMCALRTFVYYLECTVNKINPFIYLITNGKFYIRIQQLYDCYNYFLLICRSPGKMKFLYRWAAAGAR